MAKLVKLKFDGSLVYPVTLTTGVKDPASGKNISELFFSKEETFFYLSNKCSSFSGFVTTSNVIDRTSLSLKGSVVFNTATLSFVYKVDSQYYTSWNGVNDYNSFDGTSFKALSNKVFVYDTIYKMVDGSLKAITENTGWEFLGEATPSTVPITLKGTEKVFYIAVAEGTYHPDFGITYPITKLSIIKSDRGRWSVVPTSFSSEDNPFKGRRYVALGDSITYGVSPMNSTTYPSIIKSYAALTAINLGMDFVNLSTPEATMISSGDSPSIVDQFSSIENADVITFMGGTYDSIKNLPLGNMSDRSIYTYYGALHCLIQSLYSKFISGDTQNGLFKKIVALTPLKLLSKEGAYTPNSMASNANVLQENIIQYVDAVKEVSAFYSIPCLDFYNLSGINPHLDRVVKGVEPGYTGYYNYYVPDGTLPSVEGHKMMSDVLTGFLKSLK